MKSLQRFDDWHKTRRGHIVMAVAELLLAYGIGSRALDTGSWWEYGLTLLLLIGGIQNAVQALRKK